MYTPAVAFSFIQVRYLNTLQNTAFPRYLDIQCGRADTIRGEPQQYSDAAELQVVHPTSILSPCRISKSKNFFGCRLTHNPVSLLLARHNFSCVQLAQGSILAGRRNFLFSLLIARWPPSGLRPQSLD